MSLLLRRAALAALLVVALGYAGSAEPANSGESNPEGQPATSAASGVSLETSVRESQKTMEVIPAPPATVDQSRIMEASSSSSTPGSTAAPGTLGPDRETSQSTSTSVAQPTTTVATVPETKATIPPPASADPTLESGKSSFTVDIGSGREITVWSYAPDMDLSKARIVIAMHGASRNGEGARNAWVTAADEHLLIVLAPELGEDLYPGDSYNLGGTLLADGSIAEPSKWAFPIVELVFDHVTALTGSSQKEYDLYGHSAGAQFVERFALFWQSNRVDRFVIANAGWYTMLDESVGYPYGFDGSTLGVEEIKTALGGNLYLLAGEFDTDPNDPSLRKTEQAAAQGANRLERAKYFFAESASTAELLGTPLAWKFQIVAGTAHENSPMVWHTVTVLFK